MVAERETGHTCRAHTVSVFARGVSDRAAVVGSGAKVKRRRSRFSIKATAEPLVREGDTSDGGGEELCAHLNIRVS